jgi:acyl-CoA thioester hydrolase
MTPFSRTYELRWSDADANGHIRHTVYAELGAEVRMAFLREGGIDWKAFARFGIGPVLLREELDYLREVHLGESVSVDLAVSGLSPDGGRWVFRHHVSRADGVLAARVTVTGGWIDLAARRLAVPPEPLASLMSSAARTDDFRELPALKRSTD